MSYCVYKHTSPSGKVYIGLTSRDPEKRWNNGHGYNGSYFFRAIKKYGWDNFKHEIVASGLCENEAKNLEIELIAEYKSNQRLFGYNISSGGESKTGTTISDEQKEKIRKGNIGKIVSAETRAKLSAASKKMWQDKNRVEYFRKINSGANNKMFGKKMSEEEKKIRGAKAVIQLDIDGNFVNEFISIHEANKKTSIGRDGISKCCRGLYKQYCGYKWKYK